MKIDCPVDKKIERKDKIMKTFNNENGSDLTKLFFENDAISSGVISDKILKKSMKDFGCNPVYCVSLPGYGWLCGMKNTDHKLQTLQDKELMFLLENKIRVRNSSVLGHRYI